MRLSAWIRPLGSVSAAIAIAHRHRGPARGHRLDDDRRSARIRAPAPRIRRRRRTPVATPAARPPSPVRDRPHTGFGLVVASEQLARRGRAPACRGVRASPCARSRRGRSLFFVEIRGSDRTRVRDRSRSPRSASTPSRERLRALAELIRDAHLRANTPSQRLAVLVEPPTARRSSPPAPGATAFSRRPAARAADRAAALRAPRLAARRTARSSPTSSRRPPRCPPGAEGPPVLPGLHRRRDAPGRSARDPRARHSRRHPHGERRPRRGRAHRGGAARPRRCRAAGPASRSCAARAATAATASSSRAGSSGPAIAVDVFLLRAPTSCAAIPRRCSRGRSDPGSVRGWSRTTRPSPARSAPPTSSSMRSWAPGPAASPRRCSRARSRPINASGRPVVALDVPSGLPADGERRPARPSAPS